MIRIDGNFVDNPTLLRKEKKKRLEETFPDDEKLENDLWLFLYSIGFNKLNIGRQCEVTYGHDLKNALKKNIDIIAESSESRLFIECTTQQDMTSKINSWIRDVEGIRKYAMLPNKNVAFVLYATCEISANDMKHLNERGIKLVNNKVLEYFQELLRLYKNLAYYQLLGYLFTGQKIKSYNDDDLKIPAIRCKYSSKEYCYLFGIQPSKLIPLTSVLHRKMDFDSRPYETYQRLVKKDKINQIKKFITDSRGVFPTNILISFETKKSDYFKPQGKSRNNIHFGFLALPMNYDSLVVIDGQHRLFAYDGFATRRKRLNLRSRLS